MKMFSYVRLQWTKKEIRKEKRKNVFGTSHRRMQRGPAMPQKKNIRFLHHTWTACDFLRLTTSLSTHC